MSKTYVLIFLFVFLVACSQSKVSVPEVSQPETIESPPQAQIEETQSEQEQIEPIQETQAEQSNEVILTNDSNVQSVNEENLTESVSEVNEAVPEIINETQTNPEVNKITISFGDSLTYGEGVTKDKVWISILEPNVKNYAVSGATTYDVLNQIKNIRDENTAYLWIGANDAGQLIDLTTFETNYRLIVKTIKEKNMTLIILNIPDATKLEIADTAQEQLNNYLIEQYGIAIDAKPLVRQYVSLYNNIIQTIANEYNIQVIDMFNFMDSFDSSLISADGFHPNEAGHKLIADEVKRQL